MYVWVPIEKGILDNDLLSEERVNEMAHMPIIQHQLMAWAHIHTHTHTHRHTHTYEMHPVSSCVKGAVCGRGAVCERCALCGKCTH